MEILPLIAAYDQPTAAFEQLQSQISCCLEILTLASEQRARIVQAYRDIAAVIISVDELLAFERSEER